MNFSKFSWANYRANYAYTNKVANRVANRKNGLGTRVGKFKWGDVVTFISFAILTQQNKFPESFPVEYIYLITPKSDGQNEIDSAYVQNMFMPFLDSLMEHPRYQEDEFCINGSFSVEGFPLDGYDWTDEPLDVGPNEPLE